MSLILLITACSRGTAIIETSEYVESQASPTLKLPADIDGTVLESVYSIPQASGSIEGKTQEQLEQLKNPPDVLSK